ncbi:prepilin-type N-terminal cleavage/methylation domain-containing protein [Pusillimonas sp.]|uniref:type II secretion system protein n=1 Tax=Pusillimonas sp. TaxID=3040095 RepID=UPI0037CB0364
MSTPLRRQRGFALLELTIALLIATLLAVFAADRFAQRGRDAMAENHAVWMASLQQAVMRYLERYAGALVEQGEAAQLAGFSDPLRPTPAELRVAGFLAPGFPLHGARGVGAGVQLIRGADCPSEACRLDALVYSDQPMGIDVSRAHHPSMVAHWLLVSKGSGGAVMEDRPHTVGGAAFSFPNPPVVGMAPLPVGTVALAVTAEQLDSLAYLRVRDHRDPQFQGSASIAGNLSTQSALYVEQHLHINTEAVAQTLCALEGVVVQEQHGGLLVCRAGRWASAGGRGGGGYSLNSLSGCTATGLNPVTGSCSCPPGYGPVRIADSTSAVPSEGRTRGYMCVD